MIHTSNAGNRMTDTNGFIQSELQSLMPFMSYCVYLFIV